MGHLRALLIMWLACGVGCVAWPLFHGWADWPAEAQAYARWAMYRTVDARFPLSFQASLAGIGLMLTGATLLFFRIWPGLVVFCLGLLTHAYSRYSTIPTIAASNELALYAAFYLIAGAVVGVSLSLRNSHAYSPAS